MSNTLRVPGVVGGRLPADFSRPHLRVTSRLHPAAAALPPNPVVVDWLSRVPDWPMYLNDKLGDCTCAMLGHAVEAYTTYGRGSTVEVTDQDVLAAYEAVGGYRPGHPETDGGAVIQDVLSWWRKVGIGGHKIAAFARVNHQDLNEVRGAVNTFGAVLIGVNLPAIAQEQFAYSQPWDIVANDGGIEGGHAVHGGAYDSRAQTFTITTWGATQHVTEAWWLRYVEECWVAISPEWLDATGHSPRGVDLVGLGEDFSALTGEPNPFPHPAPVPPAPPVVDPDRALAAAARAWLSSHKHNRRNNALAPFLEAWVAGSGH